MNAGKHVKDIMLERHKSATVDIWLLEPKGYRLDKHNLELADTQARWALEHAITSDDSEKPQQYLYNSLNHHAVLSKRLPALFSPLSRLFSLLTPSCLLHSLHSTSATLQWLVATPYCSPCPPSHSCLSPSLCPLTLHVTKFLWKLLYISF